MTFMELTWWTDMVGSLADENAMRQYMQHMSVIPMHILGTGSVTKSWLS